MKSNKLLWYYKNTFISDLQGTSYQNKFTSLTKE